MDAKATCGWRLATGDQHLLDFFDNDFFKKKKHLLALILGSNVLVLVVFSSRPKVAPAIVVTTCNLMSTLIRPIRT